MTFSSRKYFLPVLIFLVVGLLDGSASATENDTPYEGEDTEKGRNLRDVNEFEYKYENRPDPFFPFLSTTKAVDPIDPVMGPDKPLAGMQLFEPGQLKLVAVLSVGNRSIAMVEDVAGKGYRLDEGMLIGKHGVIKQIGNEQVRITETSKTRAGRTIIKEITMRLKKEGDK
jgi:type IV pilus assembly protein PilP